MNGPKRDGPNPQETEGKQEPTVSPLTVGVSCLHYDWGSLGEAFRRAQREFGLSLIEFSTTRLEGGEYRQGGALAEATGMRTSLHAWRNPADQDFAAAVEEGKHLLDLCVDLRAEFLILHFGCSPSRAAGVDLVADVCLELGPLFAAAGVTYCLENHYPYGYRGLHELGGAPDDFVRLFHRVTSPAIRFCLDTGHSNMSGVTHAFIEQLSHKLAYAHITDNLGEHDDHLGFGQGTVDWNATLTAMLTAGFHGPYVMEYPEEGDPRRFARFVRRLQELADSVSSHKDCVWTREPE